MLSDALRGKADLFLTGEIRHHDALSAARKAHARAASKGVYVQATGPRLETRAEIAFFKTVGDVLGMTIASEATLAAELGLPYAALCSVDNYCHGIARSSVT